MRSVLTVAVAVVGVLSAQLPGQSNVPQGSARATAGSITLAQQDSVKVPGTQAGEPGRGTGNLSSEARDLAQKLGILSMLERLEHLRATYQETVARQPNIELLALRLDLLEAVLTTSYDVRSVSNTIDREIAQTNEVHAYLAEQRDRAIRLNTYANFISGGITGIVGGALKLGDVNHISPDTIDTVEGAIQSSLATWAFRQQQGERRVEQGTPNTLAGLLNESSSPPAAYPLSVWQYLNSPPPGATKPETRREMLINRWAKRRFCLIHRGHRVGNAERMQQVSGTHVEARRVTVDLLEDRMAMLTDLRSMITQMDSYLSEILNVIRGTQLAPR